MKRNLPILVSLAILAVWAVTCGAAPVIAPTQPGAEYTETINASPDKVYDALVKYFGDKGFVLDTADKAAGTIVTVKTQITDKEIISYYRDMTGDKKEYKVKGVNFGYCDCGLAETGSKKIWQNLFYNYTVDIKKLNDKTTALTVKARFWTEQYKMLAFAILEYQSDWECASTGEYERKLIEEIKANYLQK